MKRRRRILIWLACGMVLCAISRAVDAQNVPGPNAANLDALRQKMTLQNRIQLMKKLHPNGPRMGLPNGMQPLPASIPRAGNGPANRAQPNQNVDAGNPYSSIATRNVFALNPIPPPPPPTDPNQIPPPKITLTGITTIFGPAEALYKVAAFTRDGKQVPEQSYILTEGEAQDEIEVTAIDTQKDIVTFNNHNQTQVIPLSSGMATGGDSAPSAPSGALGFRRFGGNFPRPGGFGGGGPGNFQPRFGGGSNPNGNNANENNPNPYGQQANNSGYSSSYNNSYNNNNNNNASSQPDLSPDDKMALIAAQHAQAISQGSPIAPLFPPTSYDGQAQTEAGVGGNNSGGPPAP
jgi:hypothetical protein